MLLGDAEGGHCFDQWVVLATSSQMSFVSYFAHNLWLFRPPKHLEKAIRIFKMPPTTNSSFQQWFNRVSPEAMSACSSAALALHGPEPRNIN